MKDSKLILIVEDSDDDFYATLRAFKRDGNLSNPLQRCEDGQEALDYLKEPWSEEHLKPAIILLDLNLPGLDGRHVLKKIKQDKRLCNIPVVVLTTSNDEKDIEECYELGANTYIQKPVKLDSLFEAIQKLKDYWFQIAILPKGD
ncbi:two-component system response regulator [Pseudoalteromonas luteoviolacea]|uniref:Two-component system response regulator n=1 Tax=Pseudoalteromonas luteoviolacea TaxID=43657 RepID=A0A1C0TTU3_9GAMM|nr:response regulator [Pseudoalteromonas luteoviolacea]MBQ4811166.1 response regulator [Pseudoalteromonas luteoviolacea]OCQ22654.1 two-component system response regulator [Pseudoalteromonas luteoviolacea]